MGDFFERLQAVRREARAKHIHAARACVCELLQGRLGVRLNPFLFTKARLVADAHLLGG